MTKCDIRRGSAADIDMIEPLWEGLRRLHHGLSPHFRERFENMTWAGRKQALLGNSGEVLFEYAIDPAYDGVIGYCISTISKGDNPTGEIESIYVDEKYRGSGTGRRFVENAVAWFDSNGVESQKLLVGVGNEQVLDFYEKFDFFPLHIVLQRRKK